MTAFIFIWLMCHLKLIPLATPNHTLSYQMQYLYPRVVSNPIEFQVQSVLPFTLVTKPGMIFLPFITWFGSSCIILSAKIARTYNAIPISVLKLEFNSVKDLQFLTSSAMPFLYKIVNSFGVIDFAFFCFSKIALKPSESLEYLIVSEFFINVSGKPIYFTSFPLSRSLLLSFLPLWHWFLPLQPQFLLL